MKNCVRLIQNTPIGDKIRTVVAYVCVCVYIYVCLYTFARERMRKEHSWNLLICYFDIPNDLCAASPFVGLFVREYIVQCVRCAYDCGDLSKNVIGPGHTARLPRFFVFFFFVFSFTIYISLFYFYFSKATALREITKKNREHSSTYTN